MTESGLAVYQVPPIDDAGAFDVTAAPSLGEAAIQYATLGWPILPCKPRDKSPLIRGGWRAATTDLDQIAAWWARWPNANVGLRTEGRVIVDVDEPSAIRSGLHLPPTAIVETSRGYHYHYLVDRQVRSQNGIRRGIDLKGVGGYVLLPPSVHPSGTEYRWLINSDLIAEAPAWLLESATRRRRTPSPGELIYEGGRETHLTTLLGAMRRVGATGAAMLAAARAENERFHPRLRDRDLCRVAESIARYDPVAKIREPSSRAHAHTRRDRASDRATPRDSRSDPPRADGRWRPEPRWSSRDWAQRMALAPVPIHPPSSDDVVGRLANAYQAITGQPISSPDQWDLLATCYRIHADDLIPFVTDLFAARRQANNLLGIIRTSPPRTAVGA